jgi:TPR repeat protein
MKTLQTIGLRCKLVCLALLLSTFSSAYAGDCFKDKDVADCRVKAEQGDAYAQYNLGLMYRKGQGVAQDYKEAIKWYRLAAEQGVADAQYNLGVAYYKGQGVAQDYKEAVKWTRLAAEQGVAEAQTNLGVMYAQGKGVAQDYVMAHMYWNVAGVSGHKNAIKGRGLVEKEMTPSQIAEAQKLAKEWMKKH